MAAESIVVGNWGRRKQPTINTDTQQVVRGEDLAGQTVQTNQGPYVMQGPREGVQVTEPVKRLPPTVATTDNPLIVKGAPVASPTQPDQREIEIMVKKAKNETLADDDLRFLAEKALQERDTQQVIDLPDGSQKILDKNGNVVGIRSARMMAARREMEQQEAARKAADAAGMPMPQEQFLPKGQTPAQTNYQPTLEDIINMTPEERLAYQQRGYNQMAQEQMGALDQFANQQQDVYNKRIADVQAQIEAEKAKGEEGNNELLKAFEAEQRAAAAESKQDVTEAGAEGMDRLQRLAARRGMSRSSSTEKALVNASENTQKLVADIERQTNQAVREYQVQLLDKLDQKIGKLEDRVYNLGDQAAQAELASLQERQKTYVELMANDPSNPSNMLDLAQKMADQKLEESKALREEAMSVFENAIKYGFTPESLTEEQKQNIATSLGIKVSELPDIINKALTTEANKNVDVSYQVDLDGNVTAIAYNKNTGEFNTKDLGGIGKGQATRYQAVTDPITGQSRIFDPITGRFVDGGGGTGTPGYNLPTIPGQPGKVVITATTENTPKNLRENCVFFARSIVPDLPVGLVTSEQKRNMINSTIPAAGSVAMMPTFGDPKIGHVAVVEQVNADGTVTIVESNVQKAADGSMAISRRTGTPAQLGIEGYWESPKVKASNYTRPKEGEGEEINSQNTYPTEAPGQLNFERVLAKGGNVDFKQGYAAYLTETGKPASNEAYQDYTSRYYAAQEKGLTANEKPATLDQSNAALFGTRLKQSEDVFDQLASEGFDFTKQDYIAQRAAPTDIFGISTGGLGKSPELKRQEQAERNFINAVLRRESGAAIAPSEYASANLQYFPQPGDTPEVLAQKKLNRMAAIQGFEVASGTAGEKLAASLSGYSTTTPESSKMNTVKTMIQFDLNNGGQPKDIVNAMLRSEYAADVQADLDKGYTPEELIQLYTQ